MENDSRTVMFPGETGKSLNENKYQRILSVLAAHEIALWEYDTATGACKFDDDYFRILGLKEAGISFSDMDGFYRVIHPDDIDSYKEQFARMLKSATKNSKIRVRCIGDGGQVIWLENNFFSEGVDASEHTQNLIIYTANITAECEREVQIRSLEERNRKIIEALPEFIFILDDQFFIRDVLMSQSTVLLHAREELIDLDGRTVYSSEVSDLFLRNIRACLEDGEIREIEYPLDKDGTRYYFQARIAPFEGNKVMALIHDIGDRVRWSKELIEAKTRAEEADRLKSVFLATMSHEIRTPLNAIVGFSELIALGDCEETDKDEYLEIIRKNSSLLLQLINDILDLSRIESGKSENHFEQIEIVGLLDEVGKVHHMKMKEGLELKIVLPEEKIWLTTDRNRVTQVLFNFLSNALKNTERGRITLGAESREGWLDLYVTDTGCGIPEEKIPTIFGRFEKLNEFVQGTGLGLSICKSIAERLGAQIGVRSKQGEGSTFTLSLPYGQDTQAELETMTESVLVERNRYTKDKRKVILVAEDVEANFKLLADMLDKEYALRWVTNGQEAIHSFVRERPDLVLMDIKMPIMNGIEATERIRNISPDVPIIAVTAHAFYTDNQQAITAGCNAIVSKPYSPEDLKRAIGQWIGQ